MLPPRRQVMTAVKLARPASARARIALRRSSLKPATHHQESCLSANHPLPCDLHCQRCSHLDAARPPSCCAMHACMHACMHGCCLCCIIPQRSCMSSALPAISAPNGVRHRTCLAALGASPAVEPPPASLHSRRRCCRGRGSRRVALCCRAAQTCYGTAAPHPRTAAALAKATPRRGTCRSRAEAPAPAHSTRPCHPPRRRHSPPAPSRWLTGRQSRDRARGRALACAQAPHCPHPAHPRPRRRALALLGRGEGRWAAGAQRRRLPGRGTRAG